MQVQVKRLHPDAKLPTYATDGSGCFDLYAYTVENSRRAGAYVLSEVPVVCGTGLAFAVPDDHVMLVFSRSGHGFNFDTRLANCVGVIDSDYRGEVAVKLTRDIDHRSNDLLVEPGDRVAQAMVIPVERVTFVDVPDLPRTARGEGGFGSTGA